ncbi:tyrosine-type recombinase/integrase [Litchfieldia salsa]|uniref:Integrase/recombinase XerD n=1 Tax=Litchfieldia salsa TaxID=930152 RepID=A0A1H0WJM0_9BACI|nr:tyrosine-type recombinase/integrase [Litchfieldia salsa]SDP90685.1 integrase/recombinase XerD [Litchfieldia salsa]
MENLLKSFASWLSDEGKSENTIKTYDGSLRQFFEWILKNERSIHHLTREDVQDYMFHLENLNRSAATIEKAFSAISVFARFQNIQEVMSNISRLEKEKNHESPDALDKVERTALLQEVEKDGDLRNIVIVYTLLHTGIRISELCALNVVDVHLNSGNGEVFIRNDNGTTKRTIPLSKDLMLYLGRYIETLKDNQEALFISSVGKRISTRGVQYMLKKYNVNPHKLRHTFCTELVQNGIDISTVAELAGHSDVNVTKRYMPKDNPSRIEEAIKRTFA